MFSAVLIIPAPLRAAANAVSESMDWGPDNYTVSLLSDGGETVTHYGARTDVSAQFVRWITGVDPLPDPAAQPVVDALIADFSPDPADPEKPVLWGADHANAVLAEHGLTMATVL